MKITKTLAIVIVATLTASPSFAGNPNDWLTDYDEARLVASERGLPLLLHFHARWCGPCQSMDQHVLHTREVKRLLGSGIVGVKIDSDRNSSLISRFGVGALPTDMIIGSDGTIFERTSGYQDKSRYVRMIERAADRYQPKTPASTIADGDRNNAREEDSAAPPMLGLGGYSPVVLLKERQWVKGSAEFAWTYKGMTYHMRSAEELELFQSDPERYAPRLLECDPVELWRTDLAVRGDTRYGAYFDGQLFLFASSENREEFKQNPLRYTETRHVRHTSDIVRR